jgi:tetratricopeptide (TPR) repeat protein
MNSTTQEIPDSAAFSACPLPRLLISLRDRQFDGSVELVGARCQKRFIFQKGAPVSAESNLSSETLGVQLLDKGVISREDHERVSQYVKSKGCREGVALLTLKLLDPKSLFVALKDQVRRRLSECFGWPEGQYTLGPCEAQSEDVLAFRSDLLSLIQEGIESHWTADRILGDLAPRMAQYPTPIKGFRRVATRLTVDQAAQTLLAGLDGQRTLGQAMGSALNSPRALAAAWILDETGVLAYSDEPAAEPEDPNAVSFDSEIEISIEEESGTAAAAHAQASEAAGNRKVRISNRSKASSDDKARVLREEIERHHAALGDHDYYSLLGLDSDANTAAIKKAYFKAAKRLHPDALSGLGLEDLKPAAADVFALIAEAFEVLSDETKRRDYDAGLRGDAPEIDTALLAQAETHYRKGEILIRMGDFKGALEYLQPAVDLWPDECEYQSALGWALHKQSPSDPEAARQHLEKAISLRAEHAASHLRYGMLLRSVGENETGTQHVARAKQLDPEVRE